MTESNPAGVEPLVGDRERRAADEVLQAAVGDGVITLSEYDERAAVLWQARTRRQVDAVLADLPQAQVVPTRAGAPAGPGDGRPRRVVAVMSEDTLHGAVAPGQSVQGWAVMGKAVVDLRRTDLPDGTRVQVGALMGEVEVQVPPGTNVHLTGMSVMGDRKVRVAPGNGPHLHVHAQALMGAVNVTVGDGSVLDAGRPPAVAPGQAVTSRRSAAERHAGARFHGLVHRVRGIGVGGAVGLAVVAAIASGTDARAVFSSADERIGRDDAAVSVLFGSVDVVVPDGTRVDPTGLVVFGSVDCEEACGPGGTGEEVDVRTVGAFGSVSIKTESEVAAQEGGDGEDE